MMTRIRTIAVKILSPVVLAIAIFFAGPIMALQKKTVAAPVSAVRMHNETVVFKTMRTPSADQG